MAELLRIWLKRSKRGPMDAAPHVKTVAGRGLVGNANQGGARQVTMLSLREWERVTATFGLDPIVRRANLLVDDVDWRGTIGKVLRVGEMRVQICGQTRPCERMDDACVGLQKALDPPFAGGAYGRVLNDAEIRIGDVVAWEPPLQNDVTLTI